MYGSDIALLNILKKINKKKYNTFVILPYDGVLVSKLKELDINVFITNLAVIRRKNLNIKGLINYSFDFINSYRYLKEFIKNNSIDLFYTNTSTIFVGAIASRKCEIKNVWQVREIITKRSENYIISKIINRYADIVISNSKSTASSLNVDSNKIKIIYDTKGKKRVNLNKEVSVIGMAGCINRIKCQKLFVDSAEIIHRKYPDIIFKLAGSAYIGEEYMEEDIKKYIKEKNYLGK